MVKLNHNENKRLTVINKPALKNMFSPENKKLRNTASTIILEIAINVPTFISASFKSSGYN